MVRCCERIKSFLPLDNFVPDAYICVVMRRTFQYRIYPNQAQRQVLNNTLDFCRFLYNCALEERISHYKRFGKSISYNKQCAYMTEIKEMFPTETSGIYAQVLQQVLKQLNRAYDNFFRRIKEGAEKCGFPRFKKKDRFRSICFPQVKPDLSMDKGWRGLYRLPNNKLHVFGLPGELKVKWHRPWQGQIKQARVIKKGEQYYISLSCDGIIITPMLPVNQSAGIDLGLNNFITMDNGATFHHPKPWKTAKEKISKLNQKLARKQIDSRNRRKAKTQLTKAYHKATNIRDDWQHKIANKLITNYDTLVVENLNIANMLSREENKKKREANKVAGIKFVPEANRENIADAAWGNFVAKLIYKAESAGRNIIQVDPKNTSKMCCNCGNIKETLALSKRIYHCNACGAYIDRDLNAAINIRGRGGIEIASILQRHGIGLATSLTDVSETRLGSGNSLRDAEWMMIHTMEQKQ